MKKVITKSSRLVDLIDVTKGIQDSDFKRLQYKIESMNVPIYLWVDEIEISALEQLLNIANLPYIHHHVSAMPDVHSGYGMPIGGVCGLIDVISPYMVGSDIGCGMCFVPLGVYDMPKDVLLKIKADIFKTIPIGVGKKIKGKIKYNSDDMPKTKKGLCYSIIWTEHSNAINSLGSLGSGNHFVEFQKDTDTGEFGIMLHSGSRNLGNKVCMHYNKVAIEINEKYYSAVPKSWQLAFLPLDSIEGRCYFADMDYCIEYALRNRELMMETVLDIVHNYIDCHLGEMINIAHNYASKENHFGKNVVVHRKGATLARESTIGIIPGSQGSYSYIVNGKGDKDSFMSCSHGAGRPMSRSDAKKKLNLEAERKKMDRMGIIHDLKQGGLDEAEGAYKNIGEVMENQSDLIAIVRELRPIMPVKEKV